MTDTRPASDKIWHVMVRSSPGRRAMLLSSGGRTTRLRIHAIQFRSKEQAQQQANELASLNPTRTFAVKAA